MSGGLYLAGGKITASLALGSHLLRGVVCAGGVREIACTS